MEATRKDTRFVGRARELAVLRAALSEAFGGGGNVVVLVGEAGIGKTRLARELGAEARERGAVVLWGRCVDGDGFALGSPWAEALGEYVQSTKVARLREEIGSSASAIGQLVPRILGAFGLPPSQLTLSSDEERFRLYDAIGQFLLAISGSQPVLLVLDDLHWADRDSLRMLRYVARLTAHARFLILGTYRHPNAGSDRSLDLVDTLATLRRDVAFRQVPVHGLSQQEVAACLRGAASQDFPQALAQAVCAETSGNPFYVGEVFQHLVEEKKIQLRDGRWSTDFSIGEIGIPAGIRQVLAQRMVRLSNDTQRVLRAVAAFAGGFEFKVLPALIDLPEDALIDCLDEAMHAGILRSRTGLVTSYEFVHAIIRRAIYDGLNPERRARLHRQVAVALERAYAGRLGEYAQELAIQYHASASLPGGDRGIAYCLQAADQAQASSAVDRVVLLLRMARDLLNQSDLARRADLLQRLVLAEARALQFDRARDSVEDALAAINEAGSEVEPQAEFLATVARTFKDSGASAALWEPLIQRGLMLTGPRRGITWARLMLLWDRYETVSRGPITFERWSGYDEEAFAIVQASGDEDDQARALEPRFWHARGETDAILALSRTWRRPTAVMRALAVAANDYLTRHGAFREASACLDELLATAERFGSPSGQAEALTESVLALSDLGRFADACSRAERARDVLERLGPDHRLWTWRPWLDFSLAPYLDGDWTSLAVEASALLEGDRPHGTTVALLATAQAALAHARAGHQTSAERYLDALAPIWDRYEERAYMLGATLVLAADAAWTIDARRFAARFRQKALDLKAAGVGDPPLGSLSLTIARMAALHGDGPTSAEYFARARTELDDSGRRPLRAIVDYDEALAGARRGSSLPPATVDRLDAARRAFDDLGMTGWATRARQLGADDQARRVASPPRAASPAGLTPREIGVLRLIATGHSTRDIATILVVSVPTVERHISNIYGKISARGRADATAFALRHGLAPLDNGSEHER